MSSDPVTPRLRRRRRAPSTTGLAPSPVVASSKPVSNIGTRKHVFYCPRCGRKRKVCTCPVEGT